MKCPYCGEINKDGANFCVNCGYKFTGRLISNREKPYPFLLPESYLHVTPESHNDQTHSENIEKEKPKKRNHRILLLAAAIPAVLVLIFIVKFTQDSFTKERSQSASYSNVKIINETSQNSVEEKDTAFSVNSSVNNIVLDENQSPSDNQGSVTSSSSANNDLSNNSIGKDSFSTTNPVPEEEKSDLNEDETGTSTPIPTSEPETRHLISFTDDKLEERVREVTGITFGPIAEEDVCDITAIDLSSKGISNLDGIEYFTNLQILYLSDNQIHDISLLSSLTELSELYLEYNNIEDLTPLLSLRNLTVLGLENNRIANLADVVKIYQNNKANDIQILLSGNPCMEKEEEKVETNEITDVIKEENPKTLPEYISWDEANKNDHVMVWNDAALEERFRIITGISAGDIMLSDVWELEKISLTPKESTLKVSNIEVLAELQNLKEINLNYNEVKDISPLSSLKNLTWLTLNTNQISDITPLIELQKLKTIDLSNNPISDFSPLAETKLKNVTVYNTGLNDFNIDEFMDILSNLEHVEKLDLGGNMITDFYRLSELQDLIYFNMWNAEIDDENLVDLVNALKECPALRSIHLRGNYITDVSPFINLPQLTDLDLQNNAIIDVSPLGQLENLETLKLAGNIISDYEAVKGIANLTI